VNHTYSWLLFPGVEFLATSPPRRSFVVLEGGHICGNLTEKNSGHGSADKSRRPGTVESRLILTLWVMTLTCECAHTAAMCSMPSGDARLDGVLQHI
jgi:hypothetical protein